MVGIASMLVCWSTPGERGSLTSARRGWRSTRRGWLIKVHSVLTLLNFQDLLSFYSKTVGDILDGNRDVLTGVSVPASSSSLTMMLKVWNCAEWQTNWLQEDQQDTNDREGGWSRNWYRFLGRKSPTGNQLIQLRRSRPNPWKNLMWKIWTLAKCCQWSEGSI